MTLIGDAKIINNGEAYQKTISISDAQAMTDLICETLNIKKIHVTQGRRTINKHGCINFIKGYMRLNKPSEGIVLHELAHVGTCKHNKQFKEKQTELYNLWFS